MPVKVAKRRGKYRIVEVGSDKIAKTKNGKPVDGGGHGSNRVKAEAQAGHVNQAYRDKHHGIMGE